MTAAEQVGEALRESYADLLLSIPLVSLGIAITGSIFYFAVVRPQTTARSFSAWIKYLIPQENYSTASARVDIWVWVINGLLVIPIYQVCVLFGSLIAGVGFNDILTGISGPGYRLAEATWSCVVVQFLGFYFGVGIGQYSNHLAFHKVPCLWALHRAHHSAESANLFAFLRTHPVEIFLGGAVRVMTTAVGIGTALYLTGNRLLPETTAVLLWYGVINVVAGFRSLDHTHIPVRYGKVLDILIGSPILHQVHHSAELRHRDVNLAGAGYIYDWLFGTLYIPERGETWRWGLNDEELGERNPHNRVRDFFIEPLRTLRLELGKLLRMRRSVLCLAALIVWTAMPVLAETQEIVVTGSRWNGEEYSRIPAVVLERRADFLVQQVRLTNDTRSEEGRTRELHQTVRDMLADATRIPGIALGYGDEFLIPITATNHEVPLAKGENRPDTSATRLYVKMALGEKDDIQKAIAALNAFVKKARVSGRTEIKPSDEMELSLVTPEKYRYDIIGRITADAKRLQGVVASQCRVEITGLSNRVSWQRSDIAELTLYIPYQVQLRDCQ